jgi:hypothetical protein
METDDSTNNSDTSPDVEEAARKRTPSSFKPTRLIGFSTDRIKVQFEDDKGKVTGYWKTKKHNKDDKYFVKIMPRNKKNPDKKVYASVGNFPYATQIYTYKNNDSYVYIHKETDFIKITTEDFFMMLLQVMGNIDIDQDMKDKFIMASLVLQLKHYKRPFIKVPLDKIKEFKLEDIVNEFTKNSNDKKELWK